MIEVFSTNITYQLQAAIIRGRILENFPGYRVNFDLEDCDRIMRIETSGAIDAAEVIRIVNSVGFSAAILPDDVPVIEDELAPEWLAN